MLEDHTVLVVDDDPTVQMITNKILARDGINMIVASDAATATAQIKKYQPSVILMDIFLPGPISGIELCGQISSGKFRYYPRVVFLTACGAEECRERALENGGVGFITKPFDYDELAAEVASHLELVEA